MQKQLIALLLCCPALLWGAASAFCPAISEIRHVPGIYAWETDDPRFEGYFVSPQTGRGLSTSVIQFTQARWIQLSNLPDSKGMIECDYTGNYGGEVIRFVQNNHQASKQPFGQHWSCSFNPQYPATQCVCSGETKQCNF